MYNLALQPLKLLYVHYHDAYSHKTWQDGDLSWGALVDKVTWLFYYVVLLDHVAKYKFYISTTASLLHRTAPHHCLWPSGLAGWWLTLRVSTHKIAQPFDHAFSQDHVANWKHNISTFTKPLVNWRGDTPLGVHNQKFEWPLIKVV